MCVCVCFVLVLFTSLKSWWIFWLQGFLPASRVSAKVYSALLPVGKFSSDLQSIVLISQSIVLACLLFKTSLIPFDRSSFSTISLFYFDFFCIANGAELSFARVEFFFFESWL